MQSTRNRRSGRSGSVSKYPAARRPMTPSTAARLEVVEHDRRHAHEVAAGVADQPRLAGDQDALGVPLPCGAIIRGVSALRGDPLPHVLVGRLRRHELRAQPREPGARRATRRALRQREHRRGHSRPTRSQEGGEVGVADKVHVAHAVGSSSGSSSSRARPARPHARPEARHGARAGRRRRTRRGTSRQASLAVDDAGRRP